MPNMTQNANIVFYNTTDLITYGFYPNSGPFSVQVNFDTPQTVTPAMIGAGSYWVVTWLDATTNSIKKLFQIDVRQNAATTLSIFAPKTLQRLLVIFTTAIHDSC